MRGVTTLLAWLVTTVLLTLAVPALWLQQHLVDSGGFAALARESAGDPVLQGAVAAALTGQAEQLIAERGYSVDRPLVRQVAAAYTAGPSFPRQFADASRSVHRWLFTGAATGQLDIDVAPMLSGSGLRQLLGDYPLESPLESPPTMTVPLADATAAAVRPGQFQAVARWSRWAGAGFAVLAGAGAVLMLAVARRRGRALTGLGVCALLAGAAGWAGIEVVRRDIATALADTAGEMTRIAEVMVGHAVRGLHHWLNLTLAAGAALVLCGVIVAILGGLRQR